jgi:hypothetical protein
MRGGLGRQRQECGSDTTVFDARMRETRYRVTLPTDERARNAELPGTSASAVSGPERGAHGAFHAVAQNGGRAMPPHWVIGAAPEPGVESLRDG